MTKTVWILSLTPVTDEPRVRRQAEACMAQGWNVVVAGFPGRAAKPDGWTLIPFTRQGSKVYPIENIQTQAIHKTESNNTALAQVTAENPGLYRWVVRNGSRIIGLFPEGISLRMRKTVRYMLRVTLLPHIITLLRSRYSDEAAIKYYWSSVYYADLAKFLSKKIESMPAQKPSLFIGNDYFTAPIVEKLAKDCGCAFSIDIHEYAKGQYMHNTIWRLMSRPWIDRMQKIFLPSSAFNTTVCDGIADLLATDYTPMHRPAVIRSTPFYVEMPFQPVKERIKVLYHGIVYPTRGLDLAVESLPLWREEFDLIIRGPGAEDYFFALRQKAKQLGVSHRLFIEPPVLFHEIVPAANKCDIGYFVHEDISPQKRFTLPNKYFEYVMAGLALCVSDLPEMARITNNYSMGKLVSDYSPQEVARAINSFDRNSIEQCKKNSLRAARELCWEKESEKMIAAFKNIMPERQEAA